MGRTERGRRGERISTEDIIAGATLEPTYESEIHSFLCWTKYEYIDNIRVFNMNSSIASYMHPVYCTLRVVRYLEQYILKTDSHAPYGN